MQLKTFTAILGATSSALAIGTQQGQEYWQSFTSNINPLNVSIPQISQTSSIDPTQECAYYPPDSSLVNIEPTQWPTSWLTATSNGMNTSTEFQSLWNSINWANAPNIPVRKVTADNTPDMTGYDSASDPDCWWSASTCTVPKAKDVNPDIYFCPEPETWGLTYDDGPNCSHNAFYDFLEEKNLKATMFYIGSNVIDWPYGAMRGIHDGHHIAAHTWSHQLMTTLTNQELLAEFYYTQKAIKLSTGVTPRYWRPPFGDVDDRVRWIATQLNLTTVLWNLDTNDWAAGSSEPVTQVQASYDDYIKMGSNGTFAQSGNIVLTHEIDNTTMELAVQNLPNILSSYKHVVNVATCQNITYPYMEKTVAFRSFAEAIADNNSADAPAASVKAGASTDGSSSSSSSSSSPSTNSASLLSSAAVAVVMSSILAASLL